MGDYGIIGWIVFKISTMIEDITDTNPILRGSVVHNIIYKHKGL